MFHNYLKKIIQLIKPINYVEIGTTDGESFLYSQCLSVGISPFYKILHPINVELKLFRCSSEDFWKNNKLSQEINEQFVDFCFIDECHLFEEALKNFIEIEKFCNHKSLIVFDNILPSTKEIASRNYQTGPWMGDVWKMAIILRQYRPELKTIVIDDQATGLLLVTNLDAKSEVLAENLTTIIQEYLNLPFESKEILFQNLRPEKVASETEKSFLKNCLNKRKTKKELEYINWQEIIETSLPFSQKPAHDITIYQESLLTKINTRKPAFCVENCHNNPDINFANNLILTQELPRYNDFCVSILNGKVIGPRNVITPDDQIINDQITVNPLLSPKFLNEYTTAGIPSTEIPFEFIDDKCFLSRTRKIDVYRDEPTVLLTSLEPYNYGSWLFRFLPKIINIKKFGLEDYKLLIFNKKKWQQDLLEIVGIGSDKIIDHEMNTIYQFSQIFVPSLKNFNLFLDEETKSFYESLCLNLGIEKKKTNLLYVSRLNIGKKNPKYRLFVNEEEFIEELKKRNFLIIEPENYSIREQIEIFAHAKMVVGPSGAGMFNTIFCPKGITVIDIEAFSYWIQGHANLFASLEHNYGFFIGEPDQLDTTPIHKRWSLDIKKAIEKIDKILSVLS